jgi:hypothetical protein
MKADRKKLRLHKQTLRPLSGQELRAIGGGMTNVYHSLIACGTDPTGWCVLTAICF